MSELPALNESHLPASAPQGAPARFLLLYGSARPGSLSHLLVEEAGRLLRRLGGEVKIFDPAGLPLPGGPPGDHPKVKELHEAMLWSDAQLWCSPENYGTLSAVLKVQLESCPPVLNGVPLFAGKPLATVQINGAGISYNTWAALALVGRWLGMFATPSQLSIPKVQDEFDADGRMKPSPHYDRLVDLVEELSKVTLALRDGRAGLIDRYSARAQA